MALPPWLELAAVHVVVVRASAKSYAAQAAKTSGWTAARAEGPKVPERTNRTRFRKDEPDHAALRSAPSVAETYGYIGKEAVKFVKRLGAIAPESGHNLIVDSRLVSFPASSNM